ncbi:hypothetical protein BD779DRAFT_540345 [Infundibulicybe gibba]|nr:hypothetical protein BD779DRAFT_540345 [Infundibulicybe gibba]
MSLPNLHRAGAIPVPQTSLILDEPHPPTSPVAPSSLKQIDTSPNVQVVPLLPPEDSTPSPILVHEPPAYLDDPARLSPTGLARLLLPPDRFRLVPPNFEPNNQTNVARRRTLSLDSMPSLQSISDSESDRERERWGEEDDQEYDTEEERGDIEGEGERVVGPSPPLRGTAISDATSPTPVTGEPVSPGLNFSTAAGPGAPTDEPDDLAQFMSPARLSPSSTERESHVTTLNTPSGPATPPQAEQITTGSNFGPLGETWGDARVIVLPETLEQGVEEVAVPSNGDASDQSVPDPFPDPIVSETDPSYSDEPNLVPRDASADENNTPAITPVAKIPDDVGQPRGRFNSTYRWLWY